MVYKTDKLIRHQFLPLGAWSLELTAGYVGAKGAPHNRLRPNPAVLSD